MSSVSNLGLALSQVENFKSQQSLINKLSSQLSTGKITNRFSELEFGALGSKRARASLNAIETYDKNITQANRRIELMLGAIETFQAQAQDFDAALANFPEEGVHQQGDIVLFDDPLTPDVEEAVQVGMDSADPDTELATLRDLASSLFNNMFDLMNTKDSSGRYLMSGADTSTKPIEDKGLLESAIGSRLSDWKSGTITTTDFIADLTTRTTSGGNTDAITDTIVGYSAQLSAGNAGDVFVRISQTTEVKYTAHANETAFSDVLVGLAVFKNEGLPPIADTYLPGDPGYPAPPSSNGAPGETLSEMKENFYEIFGEMRAMVNNAIDGIDQIRYELESARARIDEAKQRYTTEKFLLQNTVAEIEDADPNQVAVQINSLAIQLDASYRVTARVQELTLVNFL